MHVVGPEIGQQVTSSRQLSVSHELRYLPATKGTPSEGVHAGASRRFQRAQAAWEGVVTSEEGAGRGRTAHS